MKQFYLFLFAFLMWQHQNQAQSISTEVLDSLQEVLENDLHDTLRAQTLIAIGTVYNRNNLPDSAIAPFQEALAIGERLQHSSTIIRAHGNLGGVYHVKSDFINALKKFQDMLREARKFKNTRLESMALQRIGKVYELQNDFDRALKLYEEAHEIEKNLANNSVNLAFVLNNIGNIYSYREEYKKALNYQLQSLKLREAQSINPNIGYSYNDIALIYEALDSVDKAQKYYKKSLIIFEQIDQKWEISVIGNNLARSYFNLGEYDKAFNLTKQAYQAGVDIGAYSSIESNALLLAQLYETQQNFRKAYEYAQISRSYQDSVYNEDQAKEIGRLESRLELEKKNAENLQQQEIIEEQQRTNLAIGLGLVIALVLAFFLLRGRNLLKKSNNALRESNAQINQQKEEIVAQSESLEEFFEELSQMNEEIKVKNDELLGRNLIIEKNNNDIMSSLNYGSRIQNALLPFDEQIAAAFPQNFILFKPRNIVSGDFYWFEDFGDQQILASVDCTGHGVPGAFMSMLGYGALEDAVLRRGLREPASILKHLDYYIQDVLQQQHTDNKDGMDMSICVIDQTAYQLTFAGARHPLYYFQNGEGKRLKGDHFGVGGLSTRKQKRFTNQVIDITEPTTIYVYSDGYPDQFGGEKNRKFMSKRLRKLLATHHQKPMLEQKTILETTLSTWMGKQKQIDDILVIGMRVS